LIRLISIYCSVNPFTGEKLSVDKQIDNRSLELFRQSTVHKSINEKVSYEKLEFLGDSIIGFTIFIYLDKVFPGENHKFLTETKSAIERTETLSLLCKKIGLDNYIRCKNVDIAKKESLLEDVFEAFIGAFYLSFELELTIIFIVNVIQFHVDIPSLIHYQNNPKGLLSEYFSKMKWGNPKFIKLQQYQYQNHYEKQETNNNDSKYQDNKRQRNYTIMIEIPFINNISNVRFYGSGNTKSKAEQNCAKNALTSMGIIDENGGLCNEYFNYVFQNEGQIQMNQIQLTNEIDGNINENENNNDDYVQQIHNEYNKQLTRDVVYELLKMEDIHSVVRNINDIDIKMWIEAMTHKSYLFKEDLPIELSGYVPLQLKSNKDLFLLGEFLLHFIFADYIYKRFTNENEGYLTQVRAALEKRKDHQCNIYKSQTVSRITEYLLISRDAERRGGRENIKIISKTFRAFVACIYKQFSFHAARKFVWNILDKLNWYSILTIKDYRNMVKRICKERHIFPKYLLLRTIGVEHRKIFQYGLYLVVNKDYIVNTNLPPISTGSDSSIKEAIQKSSLNFLVKLKKGELSHIFPQFT